VRLIDTGPGDTPAFIQALVKSRVRPMRGLKSFDCAKRLFPSLDAMQLVQRDFVRVPPIGALCTGGRSFVRARHIAAIITRLGRTL
jgi:hypothetical protein